MKNLLFLCIGLAFVLTRAFAQTATTNDGSWAKQFETLRGTPEADIMIRVGDIDNLGFGFEEGFNPFCGRTTTAHHFPWDALEEDAQGTDRILIPSGYNGGEGICGIDGYSDQYGKPFTKIAPLVIPLESAKGVAVKNAYLQLFIDDFQAPLFCSQFQMMVNGRRLVEGEKLLNAVNQTGPVGKLITIELPEEFYADLQGSKLSILIDDKVNSAGDGFAFDFAKLIINRKPSGVCRGNVRGFVVEKDTDTPIAGAIVQSSEKSTVKTSADGSFSFVGLPAGLEILTATAVGYTEGVGAADVAEGDEGETVYIYLEKGSKTVVFDGKTLSAGQSLVMNNILFDQGSASLRAESKKELDKIADFLKSNPSAEIELSGHTSSDGDANTNRSLSYKRVKSCKDYILAKGIDTGRIMTFGYGPDRPIASNSTEAGREQNRRVEMRIIRL